MTDFNDVIANIAANFEAQIQLLVRDARQESYESGWKNGNASSEDAHADDRATRDADSFERGYKVGRADEIETAIEAANNPSHPSSTEFQEETFRLGKSEGDMLGYERGYTAGFEDGQDEQRAMDAPIIREQFDLDPDFDPDLDPYAGVYGGEEF